MIDPEASSDDTPGIIASRVKTTPELTGNLRAHSVRLPKAAEEASGIRVLGRTIRSIVYTTDIAIIRNCDADAVFAVYPFTPQQIISKAIMEASAIPVFAGVGGGTTAGARSAMLAQDAEADGAYGVVLNAPASYTTLEMVSRVIDIPVIVTVIDADHDVVANRIAAGASILNVAAGSSTAKVVADIRKEFPDVPLIATGGPTEQSIEETVEAGANAIICTPPTSKELFSQMMNRYRDSSEVHSAMPASRSISEASLREIEARMREIRDAGFLNEK